MRPGTYRDRDGRLVRVGRTPTGATVVTYPDGRTAVVGQ